LQATLSATRRLNLPARRDRAEQGRAAQEAAGAAGLAAPPAGAGTLASGAGAAGAAPSEAADAEASGEAVSSDLLQAIAAKHMETRARIRALRIIPSFVNPRWPKRAELKRR
jgi:hypothetical protein